MTRDARKMVAVCPRTGVHLRAATPAEVKVWLEQDVRHPSFRVAVPAGDVLVDEDTGPGIWYGGAGF